MDELKSIFESVNNVPPPILLALVLSVVRLFFLKTVRHSYLNIFALIAGGAMMPLLISRAKVSFDVPSPVTYLVLQGVAAGAISILINGYLQSWLLKRQISVNDTEIITKDQANEKTVNVHVSDSTSNPTGGVLNGPNTGSNG